MIKSIIIRVINKLKYILGYADANKIRKKAEWLFCVTKCQNKNNPAGKLSISEKRQAQHAHPNGVVTFFTSYHSFFNFHTPFFIKLSYLCTPNRRT